MKSERVKIVVQLVFRKLYGLLARSFLRRVPGIWRISNILFRGAWRGVHIIEVEGSKIWVDFNDPNPALRKTFQAYGLDLIHEERTTALFKRVVRRGDVVLDLGANIGYFTLLAARLVGESGRVYAFEPEPMNFEYLKKNIAVNGYKNVLAYQKGVSGASGTAKLFVCPYDSGHHTINQPNGIKKYRQKYSGEIREVEISIVALDDFLEAEDVPSLG